MYGLSRRLAYRVGKQGNIVTKNMACRAQHCPHQLVGPKASLRSWSPGLLHPALDRKGLRLSFKCQRKPKLQALQNFGNSGLAAGVTLDVTFTYASCLACLQVSKSLLDAAMKQPKKPAAVKLSPAAVTSPEGIAELLQFREDSLTGQLGGAMARAMKGAGPSGKTAVMLTESFATVTVGMPWLSTIKTEPLHENCSYVICNMSREQRP